MKTFHLLALGAALSGLLIIATAEAEAQQPIAGSGPRTTIPRHGGPFGGSKHHGGKHHRGHFGNFILVEREVVQVVEVEREAPPAAPPVALPPPPPPRKPYVVGNSYASLPGGCMKLIEDGASYYHCSGEWYRQVGSGSSVRYKAVARPAAIFAGG